jgi:hypothetical protein
MLCEELPGLLRVSPVELVVVLEPAGDREREQFVAGRCHVRMDRTARSMLAHRPGPHFPNIVQREESVCASASGPSVQPQLGPLIVPRYWLPAQTRRIQRE